MQCPHCQSRNLKKDGFNQGSQMYQCNECGRKHKDGARKRAVKTPRIAHPCVYCGEMTKNKQFCSHSCASTYSNLHHEGRYIQRRLHKKIRTCKYCGAEL